MDKKKQKSLIEKELLTIKKQEEKLHQAAMRAKTNGWKTDLEKKIPDTVYQGLESAFCKAFSLVFKQGRGLIEKGFNQENIRNDYQIHEYAIHIKGGKREIRQMRKSAGKSGLLNMALTTAEGVGLGLLGIGLPDIALFIATLLKGIYETALHFGFEYDTKEEQYYILKMMAVALSHDKEWERLDHEVDSWSQDLDAEDDVIDPITEEDIQKQIRETASIYAMDMLVIKFIQGLPIVGIVGGAANPMYYRKVIKYVQLKYQKRYLKKLVYKESNC